MFSVGKSSFIEQIDTKIPPRNRCGYFAKNIARSLESLSTGKTFVGTLQKFSYVKRLQHQWTIEFNGNSSFTTYATFLEGKISNHWKNILKKIFFFPFQSAFLKYVPGSSGVRSSSFNLRLILWEAGITVSNKVLECLILRFAKSKLISSEAYVIVMIRLHLAHGNYDISWNFFEIFFEFFFFWNLRLVYLM